MRGWSVKVRGRDAVAVHRRMVERRQRDRRCGVGNEHPSRSPRYRNPFAPGHDHRTFGEDRECFIDGEQRFSLGTINGEVGSAHR
jgi:hypothetical protein